MLKGKRNMLIVYIFIIIIGLLLILLVIGLLLPKERVVSRQALFDTSPEKVYAVVTNNEDWGYRTNLSDLKIIRKTDVLEEWEETTKDGVVIRFTTREKVPFSFYSFDMETKMFTGYWTAEFKELENHHTLFIATEYIQVKNPLVKVLSYLFFDIGKLMETYQNDLKTKLALP